MGGVAIKDFALNNSSYATSKIDTFITVGTPFLGAAKASKTLGFGGSNFDMYGFIMQDSDGLRISQYAPSVYELAPSQAYNNFMTTNYGRSTFIWVAQTGTITNYTLEQLQNRYPYSPMTNLSNTRHATWDTSYPLVKQYHIVGDTVDTMTGINMWQLYQGYDPLHVDYFFTKGDGTVPRFSGANPGSASATIFYADTSGHLDLIRETPTQQKVLNILIGDPNSTVPGIRSTPNTSQVPLLTAYSFTSDISSFSNLSIEVTNKQNNEMKKIQFTNDGVLDTSTLAKGVNVEIMDLDKI
jgi:hypothetical protein